MLVVPKSILALFALMNLIQCEVADKDSNDPSDEAAIVSSVMYALVPTQQSDTLQFADPIDQFSAAAAVTGGEPKPVCHNYRTEFGKNVRGWQVENSMQDTYDINPTGIQLNLRPPREFIRLTDENNLPYNKIGGRGPTLNATTYMLYGKVSATIRSASTGGSVTAFILIANDGDEIDFEFVGGDSKNVQTNYFWGKSVEYTVNGRIHPVDGGAVDKGFHKYTIDWKPDRINWLVDDRVIRTRMKVETCNASNVCKFPSHPARIQFGLWDGSIQSGTAEWSKGPIDWAQPHTISAQIKDVQVECDPAFNQIVN
ncbi:MAG: concanavalin A-like lectin/glucanase domain-containing protein [Benjaminiella poitrasii]|nr:MAG: concanavalin A-like lectin/glucanase domain-containing protein [Benjaminiella poitrasii]